MSASPTARERSWLRVHFAPGEPPASSGVLQHRAQHGALEAGWAFDGAQLSVWADRYGMLPLYVHRFADGMLVGTSLAAMLEGGAPSDLDDDAIALLLRAGSLFGEDTPLRAVRRLAPGQRITRDGQGERVQGGPVKLSPSGLGFAAAAAAYHELFREGLRSEPHREGRPAVVLLSGGKDSRHILLGLQAVGRLPDHALTVFTEPFDERNNTEIAARLADLVGVPHEVMPMPKQRWSAERCKNALTDLACFEHFWMLGAHDWLRGQNAIAYDGIAGDVLSESKFLTRERVNWFERQDWEALANDHLAPEPSVSRILSAEAIRRFSRDRATARFVDVVRGYADYPNPVQAFRLAQRTRRAIAPSTFGILGSVATVRTPFLFPPLHDLLASLDVSVVLDTHLHTHVLHTAFPQAREIPFDRHMPRASVRSALFHELLPAVSGFGALRSEVGSLVRPWAWRARLLPALVANRRGSLQGMLMRAGWLVRGARRSAVPRVSIRESALRPPYPLARWLLEWPTAAHLPHRVRKAMAYRALLRGRGEPVVLRAGSASNGPTGPVTNIVAAGDIALIQREGGTVPSVDRLRVLADVLRGGCLATANFEAPVAVAAEEPVGRFGSFLRCVDVIGPLLEVLRLDVATIANNHALDYGITAFERTRSRLTAAGVSVVGLAGQAPVLLERDGVRFAILATCDDIRLPADGAPCPADLVDDAALAHRIRAARAAADVVVLHVHWGFEWGCLPPLAWRDRARAFVKAGAQVVLCHHAHVPMGVELFEDGVIAHGLGNAFFPFVTEAPHPLREATQLLFVTLSAGKVTEARVQFLRHDAQQGLVVPPPTLLSALNALQWRANSALADDARLARVERQRSAALVRSLEYWCRTGLADTAAGTAALAEGARFMRVPLRARLDGTLRSWGCTQLADAVEEYRAAVTPGELRLAAGRVLREAAQPPATRNLARAAGPPGTIGWLP